MRILIQNTYPSSPHFETELEIALNYLESGHEVYFLPGIKNFKFCYANPLNTFSKKILSASIYKNGIKKLKKQTSSPQNIHVLKYPIPNLSHLSFPKFRDVEELKGFKYKGNDFGLAAASSLISVKREHNLNMVDNEDLIDKSIYTSVFVYESAKKIFESFTPDKVILFNGRFAENRPLLRLCQELEIPFTTHERAGQLDRYLLRDNSVPHSIVDAKAEIETLWQDASKDREEIGAKFFEDRRNRKPQGWYSFTEHQKEGDLPDEFNDSYKNIVIFSSSIDEFEGIDGYSNPVYRDENSGIEAICTSLSSDKSIRIFVRVHPNLKGLQNSQIKQLDNLNNQFDNLHLIGADEIIDSYALMDSADKVVVFGSTMGIEAAFWGKPVVLIGRSFAENLNCFYKPKNHEEIIGLLTAESLPLLNCKDALKYGHWELTYGAKFKHYKSRGVNKGTFLDQEITPSLFLTILRNFVSSFRNSKHK